MASKRPDADTNGSQLNPAFARNTDGSGLTGSVTHSQEWVREVLSTTQVGLDWTNQLQLSILRAAIHWQETLILRLCHLPIGMDLMASETRVASRRLEDWGSQSSALLQQYFDSQLLLTGQMLHHLAAATHPTTGGTQD